MGFDEAGLTAATKALAAHALPAFFAALALVLVFAAAAWSLAQRYAGPQRRTKLSPPVVLAIDLCLCLAIAVGAVTLFASIAGEIGPGEELLRLDQAFSDAIGLSISPGILAAFAAVTHLGDPMTLTALGIALAIALLLRGERWLALGSMVAIAGNSVLNPILKSAFERARPLHEHGPALAQGWSFPSGHASGSVVVYGTLAYVAIRTLPAAWHLPAVLVAGAVALTVGCSRVFIQVHFASDVMAGFASGTAWLALCIGGIEAIRYLCRAPSPGKSAPKT